eukprot:TRINITY_DN103034_c0_g1_i1.p1 TRINITY_DN103034_c0_g1~~TRINITY_DN103034_c0_g1_i1.p1  ORF type:complete len:853 (-),score=187.37 TRINITY_DN103034_c0_g1_i1:148-2592(-)
MKRGAASPSKGSAFDTGGDVVRQRINQEFITIGSSGKLPPPPERRRPLACPAGAADLKVGFGMHKELTFKDLATQHPDYCRWVLKHETPGEYRMRQLQAYLEKLMGPSAEEDRHCPDAALPGESGPDALMAPSSGHSKAVGPPSWVQKLIDIGSTSEAAVAEYKALRGLKAERVQDLHAYQRAGVTFGLRRGGRVLLGDEMGLGKTVQALAIMAYYRTEWPALVVAPATLRFVWRAEIAKWLPGVVTEVVMKRSDAVSAACDICIVSYELLTQDERLRRTAKGDAYQVVVCDESHYLKSSQSQRTRAVLPLVKEAKRALLITGTPVLNSAFEVYTQLDGLLPGVIPSAGAFGDRYAFIKGEGVRAGTDAYEGSQRPEELQRCLAAVMVRRRKAEVKMELPSKRWQLIPLEPPAAVTAQDVLAFRGDVEAAQANKHGGFAKAFAAAGHAKTAPAWDYVLLMLQSMEPTEKVLLFAYHQAVLDAFEERLRTLLSGGASMHIRIDGKTPQRSREELVQRFQQKADVRVALLSITACCTGLTLTAASKVVFLELYVVPSILQQAEDRAHRVGSQHNCVDVHYLYLPDTVDDNILRTIMRKRDDLQSLLARQPSFGVADTGGDRGDAASAPRPAGGGMSVADVARPLTALGNHAAQPGARGAASKCAESSTAGAAGPSCSAKTAEAPWWNPMSGTGSPSKGAEQRRQAKAASFGGCSVDDDPIECIDDTWDIQQRFYPVPDGGPSEDVQQRFYPLADGKSVLPPEDLDEDDGDAVVVVNDLDVAQLVAMGFEAGAAAAALCANGGNVESAIETLLSGSG